MTVMEIGVLAGDRSQGSLTPAQAEFYRTEGYLVLPHLLTDDDMVPAREAMQEKVSQIADELYDEGVISDKRESEPFETRLARIFDGRTDQDFLRYGRGWRDRKPGYYELMANPKILDAVESLIGSEIFSNPVYNVRPKVPRVAAGAVPWHQDKSYWPDANSNPVITVWIPLVEANLKNGCLHVWPRTHTTRVLSFHAETYSGTAYTEIDDAHLTKIEAVPLPLEAGGAILFNDRCIHMSTPNNSDSVRWSVDLRYQPTDQDPMPQHGAGFLARCRRHPARVATREDWLAERLEHEGV
ncbi:MAG: phytanoyl-CoA dioxygenase family protein [Armatimonadota bacterium]|nr:phytanoyl-CoA dioxygenase family protein [Armatimonadota bacterium]